MEHARQLSAPTQLSTTLCSLDHYICDLAGQVVALRLPELLQVDHQDDCYLSRRQDVEESAEARGRTPVEDFLQAVALANAPAEPVRNRLPVARPLRRPHLLKRLRAD